MSRCPFDDQSGDNEHKRHIKGGRATVRSALYMATLVGIRHDPVLKGHYQNLVARGKPKKVAIVACMNKRLNYLNSLVRQPTPAAERNEAGSGAEPQEFSKKDLIFKTVANQPRVISVTFFVGR